MCGEQDAGAPVSEEDAALARDIADEVRRHGGSFGANFVLSGRPDLRKRLGDVKLLRFARRFPESFEISPGPRGGHILRCRDAAAPAACGDVADPRGVRRAPPGATLPQGSFVSNERAVHALRQLERELMRRLSVQAGARDVTWLLRNGIVRRKIAAAVRYFPVCALIVGDDPEAPGATEGGGGGEGAHTQCDEPQRSRCPVSAHARTIAGYLLQFLRDRPERFLLARSRTLDTVEFGSPLTCLYGDQECTCSVEVSLSTAAGVEAAASRPGDDAVDGARAVDAGDADDAEALLVLLARKIFEHARCTGSTRLPMSRLGREREVIAALRGRPLLQLLEHDSDRRAARGLPARFSWDTHSSAFTVSVRRGFLEELGLADDAAIDRPLLTNASASGRRPPRRPRGPPLRVEILCEQLGCVAVRKLPGVTTEATLEALQAHYEAEGLLDRRIISVSRLDRDTSGVLVAATSAEGADCLTEQFRERRVDKEYLALCVGDVQPPCGEVNARLYSSGFAEKHRAYVSPKGKEAITQYEVLERFSLRACSGEACAALVGGDELATELKHYVLRRKPGAGLLAAGGGAGLVAAAHCSGATDGDGGRPEVFSLVRCHPLTGRTHQIRAHLAWRGHPLVADASYGPRGRFRSQLVWCPRLFLHCRRVALKDLEGREFSPSLPLPDDLRDVLERRLRCLARSCGNDSEA